MKKLKKLDNSKENCPGCGVELQGDPIPKKDQESYGATHGSRKMGLYDNTLDRTTAWQCPDCEHRWMR